jgi:hypothetical protein
VADMAADRETVKRRVIGRATGRIGKDVQLWRRVRVCAYMFLIGAQVFPACVRSLVTAAGNHM